MRRARPTGCSSALSSAAGSLRGHSRATNSPGERSGVSERMYITWSTVTRYRM